MGPLHDSEGFSCLNHASFIELQSCVHSEVLTSESKLEGSLNKFIFSCILIDRNKNLVLNDNKTNCEYGAKSWTPTTKMGSRNDVRKEILRKICVPVFENGCWDIKDEPRYL